MGSCLLCLEMFSDSLRCIKTGTIRWQKLKIGDILGKHFWPLDYSRSDSFICASCWRTVDGFHKFYVRIEEAHKNFKTFKVKEETVEEFYTQKTDMSLTEVEELEDNKQNIKSVLTMPTSSGKAHAKAYMNYKTNEMTASGGETYEEFITEVKAEPETISDFRIEVKNEPTETSYEGTGNVFDCYTSDSEVSEDIDNYHEVDNSNTEKINLKSKIAKQRENDEFIVANFKHINCDLCQKQFTTFYNVKKHFRNEHNQRGYLVCCKRKFYDRFHLVDHIHLHLNPNYFKCNHCGKTMSNRRTIKNHIIKEHLENANESKCKCDECDVSINDEYLLMLHKSVHLPEDEKRFPCSNCSEIYKSFHPLFQHLKADHLIKFFKTCYACGKTFISARDFEVHINTHSDGPITLIYCDVCGLGLRSENALKRHKKNQHPADGKKDYHCPNCPKISPTVRALRKHIRTVHELNSTFECEICGKSFTRKMVLKEHMAAHTGISLYTCSWCPNTYNSSTKIFNHRKKAHPKEWEQAKLQKYSEEFQTIIASAAQKQVA